MARLLLPHDLASLTGGATEIEVGADTVRRLLIELEARFPGLGMLVDGGMAIAIDGEIHQNGWDSPIGPTSELCLLPRIGGG